MTLAQFRDINAVLITDYSVYNRNGDLLDWFTINYLEDVTESLKKAIEWENSEVKVFRVLDNVLRVTLTVDAI